MSRMRKGSLLAGGLLVSLTVATGAPAGPTAFTATTTVAVNAGKPTEFKYALSRLTVPTGTVVFKVVNRGKLAHDFKIAGKKTARLATGKAGTLRVTFAKGGKYAFLCTLPGHAAAGMKGTLTVKAPATPVAVNAGKPTEFKYALSRLTVPKGAVTFKVVNRGKLSHDFKIAGKKTKSLPSGKAAALNVTFARAGKYAFLCTLPGHASAGMKGVITVK